MRSYIMDILMNTHRGGYVTGKNLERRQLFLAYKAYLYSLHGAV